MAPFSIGDRREFVPQVRVPIFAWSSTRPPVHTRPSEWIVGDTKWEYTWRRSAYKSHLVQNTSNVSVFSMSHALPLMIVLMLYKRNCNQAVIGMCNSMHLVDKNLGKVPYFRRIGECQDFLGPRGPGFKSPRPDEKGQF